MLEYYGEDAKVHTPRFDFSYPPIVLLVLVFVRSMCSVCFMYALCSLGIN